MNEFIEVKIAAHKDGVVSPVGAMPITEEERSMKSRILKKLLQTLLSSTSNFATGGQYDLQKLISYQLHHYHHCRLFNHNKD